MNTTENNKVIAEFLGGVLSSVPNVINLPQKIGEAKIHCVKGSELLPNGTYKTCRLTELKYHKDWNLLMKVVEKIESLGYWVEILGGANNVCMIGVTNNIESFIYLDNEIKIKAVYNACLAFINWYNQQKQ